MKTQLNLLVVRLTSLIDCIERSHEKDSKYDTIVISDQDQKDLKSICDDIYKMKTDQVINMTKVVAMRQSLNDIINRLVSSNYSIDFKCEILNMHIKDLINDLVAQILA